MSDRPGKKQKALGCGCLGLLALFVIGGIGAALDDGDGKDKKNDKPAAVAMSGSPSATPSASPSPSPTPSVLRSSAPAVTKVRLPDYTGRGLQDAQDAAQELGFYRLRSHDLAGLDRFQVWDRNWQVCSQSPKPGRFDKDRVITFNVVKTDESCSYRASGSSSSSSTTGGGGSSSTSGGSSSSSGGSSSSSGGESASSGGGSSSSGGGSASSGGGSSSSTGGMSTGATAQCNDGTYSYAAHHQGACSHHGGVAVFYR
ncbi:DUF3761 domain-containing protein [Streptomyces sp. NPDC005393]|uniref:DUF3761 domain-containing protein n=1 Tax=Streptomyces sp. NPDC005393 TaxID=3157041 RepID=UPI0033AAC6CD